MKTQKRILSVLLALVMAVSLLPMAVFAEGTANGYKITLADTPRGKLTVSTQAVSPASSAAKDARVTVKAEPETGYRLKDDTVLVEQDGNKSKVETSKNEDGTFSFTMPDGDVTISAVFESIAAGAHKITLTPPENGAVSGLPEGNSANAGEKIYVNTTANEGYQAKDVEVKDADGKSVEVTKGDHGSYTFIMPASDVTINVAFEKKTENSVYKITVDTAVVNGKLTVNKQSAAKGETVIATATPDKDYEVVAVTVQPDQGLKLEISKPDTAGGSTYSFPMPGQNVKVSATFQKKGESLPGLTKEEFVKDVTKTYGDPDFTRALQGTGVTYASDKETVATVDKNSGLVSIKAAGTAKITATVPASGDQKADTATYTLTVNKMPIIVAADDITLTAGQTAPADRDLTYSILDQNNNKLTGDFLTAAPELTYKSLDNVDPNASEKKIGSVTFKDKESVKNLAKDNYVITDVRDGAVFSGKGPIEYTKGLSEEEFVKDEVRTYGDPAFTRTLSIPKTSTVLYNKSSDTTVAQVKAETGEVTILAAGTSVITATVTAADGTTREVTYKLIVNKKALAIQADDRIIKVGESVPNPNSLTYSTIGLVNGDTLDKNPTFAYESEPDNTKEGTYKIQGSGAEAKNYEISYRDGYLIIEEDDGPIKSLYNISIATPKNGVANASKQNAAPGETITVTTSPDEGYVVESLSAADKSGNALTVYNRGNGIYSFVMPASDVTVTVTFVPKASADQFKDVSKDDWFYESVNYVVNHDLMNGVFTDTFAPESSTTRGMVITVLYRLEGKPSVAGLTTPFQDVENNSWYSDAVLWAYSKQVVFGTSGTTYSPDDAITREQLAAILYRYSNFRGLQVTERGDLSKFVDAYTISEYAREPMAWVNAMGLITGADGNRLIPQEPATRAQVASCVMRLSQSLA